MTIRCFHTALGVLLCSQLSLVGCSSQGTSSTAISTPSSTPATPGSSSATPAAPTPTTPTPAPTTPAPTAPTPAPTPASTAKTGGLISLSASSYSANEATGALLFTAQRTGASVGAASVSYSTANGTAVAGGNYTAAHGTVSWSDGDESIKSVSIPIATAAFSGTKSFKILLSNASSNASLGQNSSASATIVGAGTSPSVAAGTISKSIREWVSCDGHTDDTEGVKKAFLAAADNAFTLVIDCSMRLHTGIETATSIAVSDGTTVVFKTSGEFQVEHAGAVAFEIADPTLVSLTDWNVVYL